MPPSSTSAATAVVVACKHPPGILMRKFEFDEFDAPVLGGGMRKEKRSFAVGEPFRVFGPAVPYGQAPRCRIVHGFALTTNVPGDLARAWMEQNKSSHLVKNGLIEVFPDLASAEAECKKRRGMLSGLEQLDVSMTTKNGRQIPADPRWPRATNPNLSGVQTDKRDDAA